MHRMLSAHLVRLAIMTIISASSFAASAANSLVAAYGFEEGQGSTVADTSGNGLSGTISNATWGPGKFGNALKFNGQSSSRVSVPDSALLRLTNGFTLSAWVNPQQSQPTEPSVIFKQIPGDLAYALYAKGQGIGPNAWTRSSGNYHSVSATGAIPANTWTHLASTFDGTTLSLYVNGTLIATTNAAGPADTGAGVLRIGNNSIFSNEGFVGSIDEVRIYNRALAAQEILADMAVPVSETPPVDTTPPNGTIKIDGGSASTNQTLVNLALSATDASGVAQMRFSDDGINFDPSVPYSVSSSRSVSSGEGIKTIYVEFQDSVGNQSNAISASIALDMTPPVLGSESVNSISSSATTIAWTSNEASTSVVDFGTSSSYYPSSPVDSALTLNHSLRISGLTAATTYHFRVRGSDGAGNEANGQDHTFTTLDHAAGTPQLGAHVLYTQDESFGTPVATTPTLLTQAEGSTLLALSMGWNVNFATPSDNFGNIWSPLGGMNVYAGGDFYTSVWAVPNAVGGTGHSISVTKNGRPAGEISLGFIEIANGGDVKIAYRLAPPSNLTPGTITVDGPATLIAIWGGDSFELSHTAVPDNGFSVIDSYLNLGPTSGVQVAIASKEVTEAGTYTVTWAASPQQNAACYLIAVQRPH